LAKERILFVYNTGEYLYRLRRELLVDLIAADCEVYALFPFDEATVPLEKLGVKCIELTMTAHSLAPWIELWTLLDIRKKLRKIDPDIIFAFTIKPIVYTGLSLPRNTKTRFCAMITGLGMMFAGRGVIGWIARQLATVLYRRSLAKANVVFMQNEEHGTVFMDLALINKDQYQLIAGSGVNIELFHQQAIPSQSFVFVMVARMLEHKGVGDFIAAAKILRRAGNGAEFVLAGPIVEGPHSISEDRLQGWLDGSPVRYAGAVDDVREQLARASVVVLPSVYPEGVPRILLEALATGRPILTTDTAGCRSTVEITDVTDCKYVEKMKFDRYEAEFANLFEDFRFASSLPSTPVTSSSQEITGSIPTNAHPIHGRIGQNGVLCRPGDFDALLSCMHWMTTLARAELIEMGDASRRLVESKFNVRDVNSNIRRRLFNGN